MKLPPGSLARRVALAILLGLLTTTAVAWALTLPESDDYRIYGFGRPIRDDTGREFFADVLVEFTPGRDCVIARAEGELTAALNTALPRFIADHHDPQRDFGVPPPPWFTGMPQGQTYTKWGWRIAGWPYRCLRSNSYQLAGDSALHLRGGIPIPKFLTFHTPVNDPHCNSFPLLPWWPGLIANTAIFTAPWALLLLAPPLLRRRLRLRRGHCPACGYDIQRNHTSPCPECGHARYTLVAPANAAAATTSS